MIYDQERTLTELAKEAQPVEPSFDITCGQCGTEDNFPGSDSEQIAREMFNEGWRYCDSKMYQVEGIFCPRCVAYYGGQEGVEDADID